MKNEKIEQIFFTEENLERLKELNWQLTINNELINGSNMTTATAYDVITNMSSNSIGVRRIYHEDILNKAGRISKWKLTQQKQDERSLLEIKIEFLDLAEGYAVYREQINSLNAVELALLAKQERLRNTGLTRKQKLKNIEKALAKVEKTKAKMAQ